MPNELGGTPIQSPAAFTTTLLGDADVWTSVGLGNLNSGYYGSVFADEDGSYIVQVSDDGTNWATSGSTVDITGGTWANFSIAPGAALTRIVYTNGATPQTEFRFYVYASLTYVRSN
jgi:hypothetical protein